MGEVMQRMVVERAGRLCRKEEVHEAAHREAIGEVMQRMAVEREW
jgi:hypothetical protein